MTDFLFETGCCFCGEEAHCTTAGAANCPSFDYCHGCSTAYGHRSKTGVPVQGVHAEYVRRMTSSRSLGPCKLLCPDGLRCESPFGHPGPHMTSAEIKSPPAADRTWTPAVGEMCEGERWNSDEVVIGEFMRFNPFDGDAHLKCDDGHFKDCKPNTLRPASRPSSPEAQFYGVQPAELPETLPIGTRCFYKPNDWYVAESLCVLGVGAYRAAWRCKQNGKLYGATVVSAECIDWASTPRQATHPTAPERTEPSRPAEANSCMVCFAPIASGLQACAYCAGRSHSDAYIEGAMILIDHGYRNGAYRKEPSDDLDRLAASRSKRSAHVESHRLGLDVPARVRLDKLGRPVPTGHPISWPEQGDD